MKQHLDFKSRAVKWQDLNMNLKLNNLLLHKHKIEEPMIAII